MTDDPQDLNWLAGIFELSGYMRVAKQGKYRWANVAIKRDPALAALIREAVGEIAKDSRARPVTSLDQWSLTGKPAEEFLRGIQPYVRGPRKHKITEILKEIDGT